MSKVESKVAGVDVGTMFFQVAYPDPSDPENTIIQVKRNSFVEMPPDEDLEDQLKRNNWEYVKDDGKYYVIGEDSLSVVNMFPAGTILRRPLASGVLNRNETKGLVVLSKMIEKTIGRAPTKDSVVCTCISSESVDGSPDSIAHKARLMGLFTNLGWQVKVIEEAEAVVLEEGPVMVGEDGVEIPVSGIGISFGAGRVNCVMSFRGRKIIGMSTNRSGDWIDQKVEEITGKPRGQITKKKENKLDFTKLDDNDEVIFTSDIYYGEMIKYTFSKFAAKFREVESEYQDKEIEIVIAGGTSLPKGFIHKVEEIVEELIKDKLIPFKIKGIRHASDPRNSVVKGLLTQAMITQEKIKEQREKELDNALGG